MKKLHNFTNKAIAEMLLKISQALDILGKDRFRVLAYEKAAGNVEHFSQSLINIYREKGIKGLEEIEGIGQGIAEKVEDLLRNGKMKYYEELKREIPEAELELLTIPGVGPKTAAKLFKVLKVNKIKNLPKLLQSTQAIKTFGTKTITNILEGIEIKKRLGGRYLLATIEPVAQEVARYLKDLPEVIQVAAAGSLRRKQETVGDIDIVASSRNNAATIQNFIKAPFVDKVINAGEKNKATILHKDGLQIDLEIVADREYGNLLQHFTGSKEHDVALRTWAVTKGWSVSEHGLKNLKKEQVIKCRSEEEVYQKLGMDYILPELRENRGEIESALRHQLPNLIEEKDIRGNLHLHTNESDGQLGLEQIVKAAFEYGYQYIAITDHSRGLGVAKGLDEKRLIQHRDRIKKLDQQYRKRGLRIFTGVELNLLASGDVDMDEKVLETLDFVIASVHSSFRQSQEITTKRLIKAISNPHIDCIGHPSGRKLLTREAINADWPEVFKVAAKTDTLLEINSLPDRLDLADIYLKGAKEAGVKFVINTDAHHSSHFTLMTYGINVARRGWLEKKDVINTKTAEQFIKWLEKKNESK